MLCCSYHKSMSATQLAVPCVHACPARACSLAHARSLSHALALSRVAVNSIAIKASPCNMLGMDYSIFPTTSHKINECFSCF